MSLFGKPPEHEKQFTPGFSGRAADLRIAEALEYIAAQLGHIRLLLEKKHG